MNIVHWMKKEDSGLARATLELLSTSRRQVTMFVLSNPRMMELDRLFPEWRRILTFTLFIHNSLSAIIMITSPSSCGCMENPLAALAMASA